MAGVSLPIGGFEPSAFESTAFYNQQTIPFLTAQQGVITVVTAKPITGQSGTMGQGTITPTVSVALVGLSCGAQQGSIDKAVGKLIAGQELATQQQAVTPAVSVEITGLGMSSQQGMTQQLYYPLPGLEAVSQIGTVGVLVTPPSPYFTDSETMLVNHQERRMMVPGEIRSMAIPAEQNVLYVLEEEDDAELLRR